MVKPLLQSRLEVEQARFRHSGIVCITIDQPGQKIRVRPAEGQINEKIM